MEENYKIVTTSCSEMRALARQGLQNKWNTAVLATLLQLIVVMVPTFIITFLFESDFSESLLNLYSILIGAPLSFGFITVMMKLLHNRETGATEIFYGFEKLFKTIGLYIMIYLKVLLWIFPLMFPALLLIGFNATGGVLLILLATILIIAACVLGVIASFRYAMAYYILADDPDTPIMECINRSKRMMEGNKMKLFLLQLSFFGWMLLVILSCGIVILWVQPYSTMADIIMYELMTGKLVVEHSTGVEFVTGEPKRIEPALGFNDREPAPEENNKSTSLKNEAEGSPENGEPAPTPELKDQQPAPEQAVSLQKPGQEANQPEEYLPKSF